MLLKKLRPINSRALEGSERKHSKDTCVFRKVLK